MTKVLFVCTGNICRSSTAEALLRDLRPEWLVDSCGTHGYHVGEKSDSRARFVAKNNHLNMESIRARQIEAKDFENFDFIFAMDRGHLRILNKICPSPFNAKISLFLEHGDQQFKDVPDPYYGDLSNFEETFQIIQTAMRDIITFIESH